MVTIDEATRRLRDLTDAAREASDLLVTSTSPRSLLTSRQTWELRQGVAE